MTDSASQKRRAAEQRELQTFTRRLELLRRDFDRFFRGQSRVAPLPVRTKLLRDLRASNLNRTPNTALRFGFRNLMLQLASYTAYWERRMRRLEEGTHGPQGSKTSTT